MTTFILRLPQVMEMTGLGRSSIYKGIKDGTFPAPVILSRRAVGWMGASINEWICSRPPARAVGSYASRNGEAA